MSTTRSRISHRHLLALCTFLVPLAVLALLGWSELRRTGEAAQSALAREARQFLDSAAQAIDQRLDATLPALFAASERLLADAGPVRTPLAMRDADDDADCLLDIVLLDPQFALVWPTPPPASLHLPFANEARPRGDDDEAAAALQAVDLLLTRGEHERAQALLEELLPHLDGLGAAPRGSRTARREQELAARFRLGTLHRRAGEHEAARAEFERVGRLGAGLRPGRPDSSAWPLLFLAEASLAELGRPDDRVELLRTIAGSRRDHLADGLLTAVAERLVAGIAEDAPERAEAVQLLAQEHQRAHTRRFAAGYDLVLKFGLRLRHLRPAATTVPDPASLADPRIVSTLSGRMTLLAVRPASDAERERHRCTQVGLHLDLDELLAPVLAPFADDAATFTLAIHDDVGEPLVPPPDRVPPDFEPPTLQRAGLNLRAYPADAERALAFAHAAARNRTALLAALFVTALTGALWLWRSASREAELAALKIDLVSRVSHELKTPLALIRMYGETLGMGRARDQRQAADFGGIIVREAERLTTLIQRILDFSRQQGGTLTYAVASVDLGELLRSICEAYTPHLEARGAILVETLPHDVFVRCDKNACESAIVNLLENAAKYAHDGDAEHEVELELSTAGGRAIVEVRDRGRGIPADELERVFDGFHRARNAGEVRGAGLGLSLVRHFARAHGGEVTARRRDGGGSVIRLQLPLASRPPHAEPGAPASDPS